MNTVFADTYYFLALGNNRDQGHQRAIDFAKNYHGRVITTEWVLTEVGDALSLENQRPRFLSLLELIENDPNCFVIEASHEIFVRGTDLFAQRMDKSWSLTDCISFVVMEAHAITESLTADRHFEQAGFTVLLK